MKRAFRSNEKRRNDDEQTPKKKQGKIKTKTRKNTQKNPRKKYSSFLKVDADAHVHAPSAP